MSDPSYPVFLDPAKYDKLRVSNGPLGRLKQWSEQKALDGCLSAMEGVRTVCDTPCGPGRIFHHWKRKGYRVHGRDFSKPMVEAATRLHAHLKLEGSVAEGDAFHLQDAVAETSDLVASVRFVYYFPSEQRVTLLRSLASASRRYVLAQFKSSETYRGRRNEARCRVENRGKHHCPNSQMLQEIRDAGLNPLRIEPIGEFSDRVFVLAEKPQPGATPIVHVSPAPGRLIATLLGPMLPGKAVASDGSGANPALVGPGR